MMEKLTKLIDVKSLVTLILTILFVVVAFLGDIPQEVMTIYTTVIAFYFGTQSAKSDK